MRLVRTLTLLLVCAGPTPASACNIPVFRYALERWRSERDEDRYQAIVFHRGPLTAVERRAVDALRKVSEGKGALANFVTQTADLSGEVPEPLQQLWKEQSGALLPWVVVRYPDGDEGRKPVWAGPLHAEAVRTLADSPARREIARRLMRGDSIVWVLLASGDRRRDEAAAGVLDAELRKLEKSIRLPDPTTDDSVKLLSNLPLALAFSTVRVLRDDPGEKLFVEMLLHTENDLPQSREPMVFPVFGRGRVLDALIGPGINAETVADAAHFLCGACSCLVKRLNPGVDLLLAADWDSLLDRDAVEPTPRKGVRVPLPDPTRKMEAERGEAGDAPAQPGLSRWLLMPAAVAGVLIAAGCLAAWRLRRWRQGG
jgi:hypothetical protein